ncbi:PREDICTED: single-stranded DNA-binding protein WHY1, chloroplastic-like [Tarenaya hassleriana]|uniref:single-stranded DNA-binding protein WHY1, chloroplastic-like n=1 Tax=Tarenaya hassleriana TaxID=28532 RepID=UPI00053C960F|nr:PREDICTED: single-stranded DNA-binding protein WHY1, chloroplastic-like [Tarenaya hassleriana]
MSLQLQALAFPLLRTKTINPNANHSAFLSPSSVGLECHGVCLGDNRKKMKKKKQAVKCRQSDYVDRPRFSDYSTSAETSGASPFRVFVGHTIYKGKAALTVQPRSPEFVCLDSGAFKLSKEGFVLLEFAPAAGVRQYDWSRKQVFSLSVAEIGNLVSLGPKDSCEFFHDPNKGRSDEGKVRKVLKIEPLADGSGHFFNLSVQNKLLNVDESIYIPVTRAELAVLVSAFNFILPYLMGWHAFASSTKLEDANHTNNASPSYGGGDYEWNR